MATALRGDAIKVDGQTTNCFIKSIVRVNKSHPSYSNSSLFRHLINNVKYFKSHTTAAQSHSFTLQKQLWTPDRTLQMLMHNVLQLELWAGGNNHNVLFH